MTILTLIHDDVQERPWLLQSCLCAWNTQHGLDFFFLQSLEVWNHCQILHYEHKHNNRLLLEISINITLCACMRFCYRGGFRNVWCVSVHISLPGPCYQVLTVTHEVTPRTTKRWIAFDTWLYVYISPWVTLVIISWLCIQDKQPLTDVCLTRLPIFAFFLGFCVKGYMLLTIAAVFIIVQKIKS